MSFLAGITLVFTTETQSHRGGSEESADVSVLPLWLCVSVVNTPVIQAMSCAARDERADPRSCSR